MSGLLKRAIEAARTAAAEVVAVEGSGGEESASWQNLVNDGSYVECGSILRSKEQELNNF